MADCCEAERDITPPPSALSRGIFASTPDPCPANDLDAIAVEIQRNLPRKVDIFSSIGGWHVHVGCVDIIFADVDKMLKELRAYLTAPDTKVYEKAFLAKLKRDKLKKASPKPAKSKKKARKK